MPKTPFFLPCPVFSSIPPFALLLSFLSQLLPPAEFCVLKKLVSSGSLSISYGPWLLTEYLECLQVEPGLSIKWEAFGGSIASGFQSWP